MKNIIFLFAVLLIGGIFTACSEIENLNEQSETIAQKSATIRATIEEPIGTRVALTDDEQSRTVKIDWKSGDAFSIEVNKKAYIFVYDDEDKLFTYNQQNGDFPKFFASAGTVTATYPSVEPTEYATQAGTLDGTEGLIKLTASLDVIANQPTDDINLSFQHNTSIVKLILTDENFKEKTVSVNFSASGLLPEGDMITVNNLNADGDGKFIAYLAVPATGNNLSDCTIHVKVSSGDSYKTTLGAKLITAGKLYNITKSSFDSSYAYFENGINYGEGVKIDGVIWAPVNCGYNTVDYQYGKLYQWGRKHGQGYYENQSIVDYIPVPLNAGQSEENKDRFFTTLSKPYDWLNIRVGSLWNSSTERNPVKTEYDPCPSGWRVPTSSELKNLKSNKSKWTTNSSGQEGFWFSGSKSYTTSVPQIFLPAAGSRSHSTATTTGLGNQGYYWSNTPNGDYVYYLYFVNSYVGFGEAARAPGYSIRCVKYDGDYVPISSLTLDKTSLSLYEGETETIVVTIDPTVSNNSLVLWWSEDSSVASVDQGGKVSAHTKGSTTIFAMAGMQCTKCEVSVAVPPVLKDYIDENGVNHGKGTEIDGIIWAPVNCGYDSADFKYGKLYQWGRKHGQGYYGQIYDMSSNQIGNYSDAGSNNIRQGPVELTIGQSDQYKNYFFKTESSQRDWGMFMSGQMWNSSHFPDAYPEKTEYDPCPHGWRVPTYVELSNLIENHSKMSSSNNMNGYWVSGSEAYSDTAAQIFLPAAGYRYYFNGSSQSRGSHGRYWSSHSVDGHIIFSYDIITTCTDNWRSYGYSVRCVQE